VWPGGLTRPRSKTSFRPTENASTKFSDPQYENRERGFSFPGTRASRAAMEPADFLPKRFAVKFAPARFIVEYADDAGKTRTRVVNVKVPGDAGGENVNEAGAAEKVIIDVLRAFPRRLRCTAATKTQVQRMVGKMLAASSPIAPGITSAMFVEDSQVDLDGYDDPFEDDGEAKQDEVKTNSRLAAKFQRHQATRKAERVDPEPAKTHRERIMQELRGDGSSSDDFDDLLP
jgi:hypothetical protein